LAKTPAGRGVKAGGRHGTSALAREVKYDGGLQWSGSGAREKNEKGVSVLEKASADHVHDAFGVNGGP